MSGVRIVAARRARGDTQPPQHERDIQGHPPRQDVTATWSSHSLRNDDVLSVILFLLRRTDSQCAMRHFNYFDTVAGLQQCSPVMMK